MDAKRANRTNGPTLTVLSCPDTTKNKRSQNSTQYRSPIERVKTDKWDTCVGAFYSRKLNILFVHNNFEKSKLILLLDK